MRQKEITCHACGHSWSFEPPLSRREDCPECHADARVCLNCRFYDAGSYRSCREEQASFDREKDKANYCSYFEALDGGSHGDGQKESHGQGHGQGHGAGGGAAGRSLRGSSLHGGSTNAEAAKAKTQLDALFGQRPISRDSNGQNDKLYQQNLQDELAQFLKSKK